MKKGILLTGFLLLFSAVAMAGDYPKLELYGGYAYSRFSGVYESLNMPAGVGFSVAGNFHPNIGVVADFSYNRKGFSYGEFNDSYSSLYALFGPQFRYGERDAPVSPFFRVMFGAGRQQFVSSDYNGYYTDTKTAFAYGVGTGFDVKMSKKVDLRLLQIDYLRQTGDDDLKGNVFRIGVGVVFKSR